MEIIKSYSLFLNTREANIGNSNNCTFILTPAITLSNINNRFIISTPMIELPYSFSQVNLTNNNLPYGYVDSLGNSYNSTSMNIPIGNYNINQLVTQFTTSLITDIYYHVPSSTLALNNFLISYSSSSGQCTFYMSASFTITITLNFSLSYVLGIMLGFPQLNQIFGTAVKLTSANKVMVNPITSVYVRSDSLKFQNNYESIVQTYQNSDVIAKIPITNLPNSIIYYRNDVKSMISNKEIPNLNLYVSDNLSTSYTLDLQGVNYGIYIQIDEVILKPTNAYQDKINVPTIAQPTALLSQRDDLLREIIDKKIKLEKEIDDMKQQNQDSIKIQPIDNALPITKIQEGVQSPESTNQQNIQQSPASLVTTSSLTNDETKSTIPASLVTTSSSTIEDTRNTQRDTQREKII